MPLEVSKRGYHNKIFERKKDFQMRYYHKFMKNYLFSVSGLFFKNKF